MEFEIIDKTPIFQAFSELGKRIFLPDGIFYWSGRAKKEADIIGTIGSAFGFEKDFIDGGEERWVPCYLKDIKQFFNADVTNIVPYASIPGLIENRKKWKDWVIKKSQFIDRYRNKKEIFEKFLVLPLLTPGITFGIYTCCSMFLNRGELIISPDKRWGNYDNIIEKNLGAKIQSFTFFKDEKIDIESLKIAINEVSKTQNKIVLLLNFPNNPTGYIPTKSEAAELIALFKNTAETLQKPIVIICDDAYEGYPYDSEGIKISLFYDLIDLDENIIPIKLDGITKELLMYGGRIGAITIGLHKKWFASDSDLEKCKAELENKFSGFIRSSVSNSNIFYQTVLNALLSEENIETTLQNRKKVEDMLRDRYKLINSELKKIDSDEISIDPNRGGFFLFVNLRTIKATEFADLLLRKYRVGVIPIEKPQLGINGFRIAYCSIDIKKIPELVSRIQEALKEYN